MGRESLGRRRRKLGLRHMPKPNPTRPMIHTIHHTLALLDLEPNVPSLRLPSGMISLVMLPIMKYQIRGK